MSTTIKCDYGYVYYSCQGGKYEGCSDENPCWLYDGPLASIPDEPETDSTETDSTTSSTAWTLTSRADNFDYPYRPSTGTFEMDGVAISGVELPAASIPEGTDIVKTAAMAPDKASESDTVNTAEAAPDEASESGTYPPTPEPAATLASPSSPKGKITYVNQWNEYEILTAEEALAAEESMTAEEAVGGKDKLEE
ncbi:hypothetical protein E4U17_004830 [Claviceps sp. LM77 group G4]|nr:hypothetical protein E4U17_004830 [Claviceps sp. LM77 group G4]